MKQHLSVPVVLEDLIKHLKTMLLFLLPLLALFVVTLGQEPPFYPDLMNTPDGQGCYTLVPYRSTPNIARPIDCQDVMELGANDTGIYFINFFILLNIIYI